MKKNDTYHFWFHQTLAPLLLICLCPPIIFAFWYTNTHLDGSLEAFWSLLTKVGVKETFNIIWKPYFWGTLTAWKILAVFSFFQLLFMRFLPGKIKEGPITPKGHVPIYKDNGLAAFLTTMVLFYLATSTLNLFSATILYDNLGGLLGALNIFSLIFCFFLLIKGLTFPSGEDAGRSGNWVFDYYWGTELYPRILGWDVKVFTNCRFGLMIWPILLWSYAAKQQQIYGTISDSMLVAVGLQWIYILKFFIWESGYLRSLDIMHDRAGYYICWGCLVWVPGVYTFSTLYLVNHPNHLGWLTAGFLFAFGTLCILVNYFADRQRQIMRATGGECKIWGKKPTFTTAAYITESGEKKQNILLTSGWWGIARHFHYIPEILAALCWTLPALFTHVIPYFYLSFLIILLFNRAWRDDERCANKYGDDWNEYCSKVPYKIIPYII